VAHSPLASPSATRDVLARYGLGLKKSLGQHFLVDDNVIGRIVALADLPPGAVVLEIGPGIGTLTYALCARARAVVAVERDLALVPALEEVRRSCEGLTIVTGDAVRVAAEDLDTAFGPPEWLVANLPYAVAATVVLRSLEEIPSLRAAVVMVQAEVAARMMAVPGTKDYGAYTVKLRLLARPVGSFAVPRGCFMPPPRVDSTVLRLERLPVPLPEGERVATARLATAAFAQRRKTIRNSVLSVTGWEAAAFDAALSGAGIEPRRRAESLAVEEFLRLSAEVRKQGLLP
jgi:16S rRNA (adenine1518-N6/adenine1519-N6)-dimethyltransferase